MDDQREAGLIPPLETAGKVIIEWPADCRPAIPGWALCVYDADTGTQITTVTGMVIIHAPADGVVWAQMTIFTTADGKPIFSGTDEIVFRDGEALTGTFPFWVQGMRVRDA